MSPGAPNAMAVGAVAWTDTTRRAIELAEALGGEARLFGGLGLRGRRTAPLRYLVNVLRTTAWFARRRPRTLIVQNPPIVLAILGLGLTRLRRGELILDSHPASFGLKGRRVWAAVLPLHRFVARRSSAVLVTVEDLAAEVRRWGGTPLLVHEPPPAASRRSIRPADSPAVAADGRFEVLVVNVFASDEPVAALLAAAALVPDVRLRVTGDAARAPDLAAQAPDNVEFTGYLRGQDYVEALRSASAILALTTEPTSVMRAGYEAVYAGRPLIVSDWPVAHEVFPHAIHVGNEPQQIARGVADARREIGRLLELAPQAAEEQERRWSTQLDALRHHALGRQAVAAT